MNALKSWRRRKSTPSNAVGQVRGGLDYDTHWDRAFYFQMSGPDDPLNYDLAICEYQKAIDLNIVDSNLLLEASEAFVSAGRPDDAIDMIRRAGRSIRHDWYRWDLAWAYFFKARLGGEVFYKLAIDEIRQMYWSPGEPKYMIDVQLLAAACYARLGKSDMSQTSFTLFSNASNGEPTRQSTMRIGLGHSSMRKIACIGWRPASWQACQIPARFSREMAACRADMKEAQGSKDLELHISNMDLEFADRGALRHLQWTVLGPILAKAAGRNPFYAERWQRSGVDLDRIRVDR